jgi:hypothetical protein
VSAREPGLDLHEWIARWEALEPDVRAEPARALPELADLAEEMLREAGFPLEDDVAAEGVSPDVLHSYRSARELADQSERGVPVDPGEIGQAIENLREVYGYLTGERAEL